MKFTVTRKTDNSLRIEKAIRSLLTITVYGPQGCGKSKLIEKISKLVIEEIELGHLTVDMVDVKEENAR